jgi:trimeric autotransporter adhesin
MRFLNLKSLTVLVIAICLPQLSAAQYSISSIAGGGPNNLSSLSASLGYAGSIARDAGGNSYIADSYSSHIFKVSASGTLTVLAGNGTFGYSGDGGPATSAALNRPQGVALDGSGNIFIADTDNSVIREVVATTGIIQTVAGSGTAAYGGDGGPATSAALNSPSGLFVDSSGNIFIADTDNSVIREVLAASGNIQTVAGNGTAGYSGDAGPATSAELDEPEGVFVDASGNIFIADTFNSVVREVTAGNISTVVGAYYAYSTCIYSGDGGPATSAQLCLPGGVFVDGSGDIFVADTNNSVIREVVAGTITTVAGNGTAGYAGDGLAATSAELNYPDGTFVDSSANIFIADTENFVIREVTAGIIQTVFGNNTLAYSGDGGLAVNAELNAPGRTFVDASGDIYISDTYNSVIREVVASSGNIQTVAGDGVAGYAGDGGLGTSANLNFPYGAVVDGAGNIFIADTENSVIREVVAATGNIETVAGTGTAGYSGDGGAATSADLSGPYAVAVDAAGNIFIADKQNSAIRVVNTGTQAVTIAGVVIQPGAIATVAGNGTECDLTTNPNCGDGGAAASAQLSFPTGISLDASDDIFVADTFNNAVREINGTTGIIQTVAGTLGTRGYSGDNGASTSALLNTPYGVFVDSLGNIFVADTENSVIREVVAVTATIQTVAGDGTAGFAGDGGAATSAELNGPIGVAGDAAGNLYIADSENSRVRELSSTLSEQVYPGSTTLPASGAQQFAAVVTGANNTAVTWRVNNQTGGSSKWGTISSMGSYQAPANVPAPGVVTVTAISNANGFTSASAQVNIVSGNSATVTVNATPAGVTEVYTGTTQTFKATVTGETNTAVAWQVNKIAGGNPTFGTVSSAGSYSAPSSVPTPSLILITAASQANPAVLGVYPFTVVAAPTASQPAAQTISPGGTAKYAISLNANTGDPKQPITLSCVQSSLPAGATCTFSPKTITPAATDVPFTLTVAVPSTSAALHQSLRPWLLPQVFAAFMPLAGILLLPRKRNRRSRRISLVPLCLLLLLTACGGGSSSSANSTQPTQNAQPASYTIQIQGTTAAQPNPITITSASLTVQ